MATAVKSKAGAVVKECEAEFEITNFVATCAVTKSISEGKQDCREIVSGPILVARVFRFGIAVAWSVKSDGSVEESKNLGVHVKRLDDSTEECTISLEMSILNRKPGSHMTLCDPTYHAIHSGKARGWSRSFDMPDNRRHEGVKGLPLLDVFDAQAGWLQGGSLRVTAKLSVVVSMEGPTTTPGASCGNSSSSSSSFLEAATEGEREVCDSLQEFLRSGYMTDVVIKVGDVRIDVHSVILAARSPVFRGMFSCPMKEKEEREVDIQDIEPCAMRALVNYMYSGAVAASQLENEESATALLQAAHRYEVPGLIQRCVQVLADSLDLENCAERLELADTLGHWCFKARCLDFLQPRMAEVQSTEGYLRLAERRPALLKDIVEAILPPAKRPKKVKGGGSGCGK